MNAKQLREELAEYDDDLDVVIPNPHVEKAVAHGIEKATRAAVVETEDGDTEVVEEDYLEIR